MLTDKQLQKEYQKQIAQHHRKIWAIRQKMAATHPQQMNKHIQETYGGDDWEAQEYVYIIALNNRNEIIKSVRLFVGGRDRTVIDNALILKFLVNCSARYFITAHNHPSGYLKPSLEDVSFFNKAKMVAELCGFKNIDNIIFSRNEYVSGLESGWLINYETVA